MVYERKTQKISPGKTTWTELAPKMINGIGHDWANIRLSIGAAAGKRLLAKASAPEELVIAAKALDNLGRTQQQRYRVRTNICYPETLVSEYLRNIWPVLLATRSTTVYWQRR